VPSPGDSISIGGEQVCGERECVPDAQAQFDMQRSREREVQERRMRDSAGHATPLGVDVRDVEVGE
jgi:hypothetical protein